MDCHRVEEEEAHGYSHRRTTAAKTHVPFRQNGEQVVSKGKPHTRGCEALLLIEKHTKLSRKDSKFSLPHASVKRKADEEKSMPQDIVSGEADSASVKSVTSSKTSLTVSQGKQVDKVFAEDLQSGIEPTKKRVVAPMKCYIVFCSLVNSQPHVKRVLDRVRYLKTGQQWTHMNYHKKVLTRGRPHLLPVFQSDHHQASHLEGWSGTPKKQKPSRRP